MRWASIAAVKVPPRVVLMAAAVLLPAGCSLPLVGGAPDVVTPAQAVVVVRQNWTTGEKANLALDNSLQEANEAEPALAVDTYSFQSEQATGRAQKVARPLNSVTALVPHQSGYPAQFLAEVTTVLIDQNHPDQLTTTADRYLVEFGKASAAASWKAEAFAELAVGKDFPSFARDQGGYATLVATQDYGGYGIAAGGLAQALADYLRAYEGGQKPATFAPGPFTDQNATQLQQHFSHMRDLGYQQTDSYNPLDYVRAYQAADRSALVMFGFDETITTTVAPGQCIVQDPNRQNWDGTLAPGAYSTLAEHERVLWLASDPAGGGTAKPSVLGSYGGATGVDSTPGPPGCG
jgi:hypothetical protein